MTQRTTQQNRALHKAFSLLAEELNDAGLDMRTVLKSDVSINWTPSMVKEYLWRSIQKIMYSKESTTELEKIGEIEKIWDTLMRHLGEKYGIEYIPFPHDSEKAKENLGGYKSKAGQTPEGVEYPEHTDGTAFDEPLTPFTRNGNVKM
jgi:hypothetical protein